VEVIAKDPLLTYEIVEEHISENDVCALKARILQMLTPEERDLFEQIYEKHVKRKEVAKQLNITENALNVRIHRLKNHIKSLTNAVLMVMIFILVKCR
jgi:DNA-directed RNA polymerase specialized sigma24 family protein